MQLISLPFSTGTPHRFVFRRYNSRVIRMGSPNQDGGTPWRLPGTWKPFANRWGPNTDSVSQRQDIHIEAEVPKQVDSRRRSKDLSLNSKSQKPTARLKPLDPTAPSYLPTYSTSQSPGQVESVEPSAAETRVVDTPTRSVRFGEVP